MPYFVGPSYPGVCIFCKLAEGNSFANAVSADESLVVGRAANDGVFSCAFRLTEADGMQDLGSLRTDRQGGSEARAVNVAGLIVTGRAKTCSGVFRAFIWRHQDTAKSAIEDFTKLALSFTVLSTDNAVAVAEQQYAADQVVRLVGVASRTGERLFSARGSIQYTGRNPTPNRVPHDWLFHLELWIRGN